MKSNHLLAGLFLLASVLSSLSSFSPERPAGLVEDVLNQTNKFRRSKGLPTLILNSDLNAIAEKHSINMAKGRVGFGHGGFSKRNKEAGKVINPLSRFAENVAYGASSGKEVVSGWKNSPGHRKNILGRFKYIGIGISKDRKGRIYYTQLFAG